MGAQLQQPMQVQERGQRAGNQQRIIKVVVQKCDVEARLEAPAVQRIEQTAQQEKAVSQITKRFHSKARMTMPNAMAKASLINNIIRED